MTWSTRALGDDEIDATLMYVRLQKCIVPQGIAHSFLRSMGAAVWYAVDFDLFCKACGARGVVLY